MTLVATATAAAIVFFIFHFLLLYIVLSVTNWDKLSSEIKKIAISPYF